MQVAMEVKRCVVCHGSGTVMSGGMIMKDCDKCDGRGKLETAQDEISYLTLKQSESFQNAIAELKSIDPKLSDSDAEKLMQKQYNKSSKRRERVKKS